MNKNVAKSIKSVLANMALLVFCLIYLSPIYIIVVNSFKSRAEMYTNVLALPETLTWEYYAGAVQRMDFINVFKNSIIVTLCSVVVIVVLCAMAAWMLVRTHTRLSRLLYSFLIVTMLIPFQTVMMPLMQEMNSLTKTLGIPMKNSLGGLVFMYAGFGAGMGVFVPRVCQIVGSRLAGGGCHHRRMQYLAGVLAHRIPHPQAHHRHGDHSGCDLDLERLSASVSDADQ